jgi:hypothetical protein
MTIRVGVEGGRRPVLACARRLGAPILVSANSLWRPKARKFANYQCYQGHDLALDSGGLVAMKRYGGYRWTVPQYVNLARDLRPTWWAQMDFCCEPEIANERRAVFQRIDWTVSHLNECQRLARECGAADPMPVLQGYKPADYCSGPIYSPGFRWPRLVGIGSVCRRQVHGSDGILAVLAAIDQKVPAHVGFHLFGVKSTALLILCRDFPHRIHSVDSMAWNFDCRQVARKLQIRCDGFMRADFMRDWYLRQLRHLS